MLTQSATVKTPTVTQSSAGGAIKSFNNSYSGMPCMLNENTSTEGHEFGKRTTRGSFRVYAEPNDSAKAITKSDRIILDSRTFEVVGVPYNVSNRDVLMHIDCEEIL